MRAHLSSENMLKWCVCGWKVKKICASEEKLGYILNLLH